VASSTLLLLDGDDDFREALSEALSDDGFRVIACASEQEIPAPETMATVGVLLSADESPLRSILGFVDRFHILYPTVPAILLAAFVSVELENEVRERPFVHLLRKPVDYENLHQLVCRLST